jgi:hypothetical protein
MIAAGYDGGRWPERMVASYDDARKIAGKAATRKMREMFVPVAKHQPRALHGPQIER